MSIYVVAILGGLIIFAFACLLFFLGFLAFRRCLPVLLQPCAGRLAVAWLLVVVGSTIAGTAIAFAIGWTVESELALYGSTLGLLMGISGGVVSCAIVNAEQDKSSVRGKPRR